MMRKSFNSDGAVTKEAPRRPMFPEMRTTNLDKMQMQQLQRDFGEGRWASLLEVDLGRAPQ